MSAASTFRPDTMRIFGYSSSIALHLCALGLLLIPMQAPLPVPADPPIVTRFVDLRDPPPPPKPVPVPVEQPRPVPTPSRAQPQPQLPPAPVPVPVVVEQGLLPAPRIEPPATPAMPAQPAVAPGPAAMHLQYAHAPPPPYPREELRRGVTGTVLLEVLVDVDGRPLRVEIAESSGHRRLDVAARRHVLRQWTFRPATRDGQPVQAVGLVPIEYSLE